MTRSISLKTGKNFNVPEGFHIDIVMDIIDNEVDDEILKYPILVITNDNADVEDKNIKERCYMLSDILSYGDDLEGCP